MPRLRARSEDGGKMNLNASSFSATLFALPVVTLVCALATRIGARKNIAESVDTDSFMKARAMSEIGRRSMTDTG